MQHDVTLSLGPVALRPLDPTTDGPRLRAVVDEAMWAGNSVPLPADGDAMRQHLAEMVDRPAVMAFAVELDGRFVGRTALYDMLPGVRTELGHTIYAREVWAGIVNPTCKMLLMRHGFDELGVHRVALRCDSRNTRSRRAIERLGARHEGTLRRFRPSADGTVCDVEYFSVIRDEWPAVRAGLEQRIAGRGAS